MKVELEFKDLVEIGQVRNKIISLIHTTEIPEVLIEEMLIPIEKILTDNGVKLNEDDY